MGSNPIVSVEVFNALVELFCLIRRMAGFDSPEDHWLCSLAEILHTRRGFESHHSRCPQARDS